MSISMKKGKFIFNFIVTLSIVLSFLYKEAVYNGKRKGNLMNCRTIEPYSQTSTASN